MTEEKSWYMIEATLEDSKRITNIRDELYNELPGTENHYHKLEPHLTVIPPFRVSTEIAHDIRELNAEQEFETEPVNIHGASVWPSLNNPRVLLLDVSVNFQQKRDTIYTYLKENDAEFKYEPVPFHISLFKCDNGYVIPDEFKQLIQDEIAKHRDTWTTEIKYSDVKEVQ